MQVVEHRVEVLCLVPRDAGPFPLPRRAKVGRQLDLFILSEQALRDGGEAERQGWRISLGPNFLSSNAGTQLGRLLRKIWG